MAREVVDHLKFWMAKKMSCETEFLDDCEIRCHVAGGLTGHLKVAWLNNAQHFRKESAKSSIW